MAHSLLWYQGSQPFQAVRCTGKPEFQCPEATETAAEYLRGFYTHTNVLNPNIFYDDLSAETWLKKFLQDVKVGDYLWLVMIPPMHRVIDVFAYNDTTETEHASLDTMGGITLSLVTGKFKRADDDGNCEMEDEQQRGTLIMAEAPNAKQVFTHAEINEVNDTETFLGVGFKVDALPSKRNLADIVGKIAIGAHTMDYGSQTFM